MIKKKGLSLKDLGFKKGQTLLTISVIIPCKTKADLCPELLPALKNAQIIVVDDKLCPGSPAEKRDFGAKKSVGSVLAFIDSDAYPHKHWLKHALIHLRSPQVAAVCGPGLTPPSDSTRQKISGLVWSTKIGSGPYTYRNRREKSRFIDDYPTYNLLVKRKDFLAVNGFNTKFWPGEDTKLCLDLTHKLDKKILYHPDIVVYHHRRPVWLPHLQQISRYGFQRGRFVRLFPRTSFRLSYFLPLLLPIIFPIYLLALFFTGIVNRSLLLAPAILLTHLTYAIFFLKGLVTKVRPL